MNILIVEDENIIRHGLTHIISNLSIKFDHIYEATNGLEALQIINKKEIDIVISDIKMPKMSGLEFIEKCYKIYPDIQFIILSGFSDFDFAQQAIKFGVKDYLLKPIDKNILTETLSKVVRTVLKNRENNLLIERQTTKYSEIQNQFLWKIVKNETDSDSIEAHLKNFGIQLTLSSFCVIAVKQKKSDVFSPIRFLESDFGKLLTQNNDVFLNSISKYDYHFYLLNVDNNFLISAKESLLIDNDFQKRFTLGFSSTTDKVDDLPRLIQEARIALDNRLFYPEKHFFYYNLIYSTRELKQKYNLNKIKQELLLSPVKKWDTLLINHFNSLIKIDNNIYTYSLLILCFEVQETKVKQFKETQANLPLLTKSKLHYEVSRAEKLEDFLTYFIMETKKIDDQINQLTKRLDPISKVINYIETNYHEDITLSQVAGLVSMNPSYFSTQFKKKTGATFSQYLQQIRIDKALILLQDPDLKIIEIANSVGFQDEKYFFKVFKKITGQTPRKKD